MTNAPIHRFLLVEDDQEIREIVAEMLVEEGFDVVTAANGVEGLEKLRQATAVDLSRASPANGKMCLVLLDLMMPVMDGWEMRAAMLADPVLANIPVVVISGAADLRGTAESLQVAEVVPKPMRFPVLLDAVQRHCEHARAAARLAVH